MYLKTSAFCPHSCKMFLLGTEFYLDRLFLSAYSIVFSVSLLVLDVFICLFPCLLRSISSILQFHCYVFNYEFFTYLLCISYISGFVSFIHLKKSQSSLKISHFLFFLNSLLEYRLNVC